MAEQKPTLKELASELTTVIAPKKSELNQKLQKAQQELRKIQDEMENIESKAVLIQQQRSKILESLKDLCYEIGERIITDHNITTHNEFINWYNKKNENIEPLINSTFEQTSYNQTNKHYRKQILHKLRKHDIAKSTVASQLHMPLDTFTTLLTQIESSTTDQTEKCKEILDAIANILDNKDNTIDNRYYVNAIKKLIGKTKLSVIANSLNISLNQFTRLLSKNDTEQTKNLYYKLIAINKEIKDIAIFEHTMTATKAQYAIIAIIDNQLTKYYEQCPEPLGAIDYADLTYTKDQHCAKLLDRESAINFYQSYNKEIAQYDSTKLIEMIPVNPYDQYKYTQLKK